MSRIVEPHPTVPKNGGYVGGGIGGAGNYRKYTSEELTVGNNASGPASRVPLTRPSKRVVPSGRGGAGNMIRESEEPMFQFDEDMVKKRDTEAPVYRVGRGGAGNLFSQAPKPSSSRKDSNDSSASESERVNFRPSGAARHNSAFSIFSKRSA